MIQPYSFTTLPKVHWPRAARVLGPFLSYAWHRLRWETFREGEPWILDVDDAIIAPFIRKDMIATFSGGRSIADYLDLVGPDAKKADTWHKAIRQ